MTPHGWTWSSIHPSQESLIIECHPILSRVIHDRMSSSLVKSCVSSPSSIDRYRQASSIAKYWIWASIQYWIWHGVSRCGFISMHVKYQVLSSIKHCVVWMSVKYDRVWHVIQSTPVSSIEYQVLCIKYHQAWYQVWKSSDDQILSLIYYGRVLNIEYYQILSSISTKYWRVSSTEVYSLWWSSVSLYGLVSNMDQSHPVPSITYHQAWYHVDECQVSFTMVEYCLVSSMEYPTWSSVIEYGVLLMIVENRVSSIEYHRVPSLI